MPQFDTFSFFSQLFWVFVGFLLLYLSICFYLLPALGSILKIRKRKLAQVSTSGESVALVANSGFVEATKQTLASFNTKFASLVNDTTNKDSTTATATLNKNLGAVSVKFEASREFNLNIFSVAQRASLLHS
jgi:F0F1-type ATP synthase membrane subunit b/b'